MDQYYRPDCISHKHIRFRHGCSVVRATSENQDDWGFRWRAGDSHCRGCLCASLWKFFERQGEAWVEYPPYVPGQNFRFNEARRDDQYIYLYDKTRHKKNDPVRVLYLRLPITGGMAQWSYPNPFTWQDLYPVTPKER